jgi:hypothetical protein
MYVFGLLFLHSQSVGLTKIQPRNEKQTKCTHYLI